MKPFDEKTYVPILLCKRGERKALGETPDVVAGRMRPLLVVPAPDWDYEAKKPKKTVAEHISGLPADLVKVWSPLEAFLDASALGDLPLDDGRHPLDWLVENAQALGLPLTPVVHMESTDAYVEAASRWTGDLGTCIRLSADFWPASAADDVEELLSELGAKPSVTHLVLDMGDDVGTFAAKAALAELQSLPHVDEWASITIAATALPPQLPSGGSTLHTIPRQEWKVYSALCASALPRTPSFGDYAINGAGDPPDVDPKLLSISASLRYTTDGDLLVSKGQLYKGTGGRGQGGAAVPAAADALLSHGDYMGDAHCAAEAWLNQAAAGGAPGNPETWRRIGTVHHLQVVTDQISTMHGS